MNGTRVKANFVCSYCGRVPHTIRDCSSSYIILGAFCSRCGIFWPIDSLREVRASISKERFVEMGK